MVVTTPITFLFAALAYQVTFHLDKKRRKNKREKTQTGLKLREQDTHPTPVDPRDAQGPRPSHSHFFCCSRMFSLHSARS